MLPSVIITTSAPTTDPFRGSITRPAHSLSTLRSPDYSGTTQDSLPAAGQLCRAGLITRRVPMQGFKRLCDPPCPGLAWRTIIRVKGLPKPTLADWAPLSVQRSSVHEPPPHISLAPVPGQRAIRRTVVAKLAYGDRNWRFFERNMNDLRSLPIYPFSQCCRPKRPEFSGLQNRTIVRVCRDDRDFVNVNRLLNFKRNPIGIETSSLTNYQYHVF